MKKNTKIAVFLATILLATSLFSGCQMVQTLLNKIPEVYTEGMKYDRDFPDNVIEVYDDAIVFESITLFGEMIITSGSEDDLDDIVNFYKDLFEDKEIILSRELDERDEYIAEFQAEGYAFRLQIIEAEGEYIEDLFKNVVTLGAKEIPKTQIEAVPTPTPDVTTTQESEPTTTPEPSQAVVSDTYLTLGSWTLSSSTEYGIFEGDMNLEIFADLTGVLYYFNVYTDEFWSVDFEYTFADGVLTFDFLNDTSVSYYATIDEYGWLNCVNTMDSSLSYTYYNWNDLTGFYPSSDSFEALGCWFFYEPETGYLETMSFWDDNRGMFYDSETGTSSEFTYTYTDFIVTINFDDSSYEYYLDHRGNILEFYDDSSTIVLFMRVGASLVSGSYYMTDTNDVVEDWSFTLNNDYSASTSITVNGNTTEDSNAYWVLSSYKGMIDLYSSDDYLYMNFLYTPAGLYFEDEYHYFYYAFEAVG